MLLCRHSRMNNYCGTLHCRFYHLLGTYYPRSYSFNEHNNWSDSYNNQRRNYHEYQNLSERVYNNNHNENHQSNYTQLLNNNTITIHHQIIINIQIFQLIIFRRHKICIDSDKVSTKKLSSRTSSFKNSANYNQQQPPMGSKNSKTPTISAAAHSKSTIIS